MPFHAHIEWDSLTAADWRRTDAALARRLGVSRQSVANARRVRGIAPRPWGGKRPGSGRPPAH